MNWILFAAAPLAALAAFLFLSNYGVGLTRGNIVPSLKQKFADQGIQADSWSGVFVNFSPAAMHRSRTLGRLFWKLTAIAVLLWCAGQALGAYYGSYLNLPTRSLWFVDIFYVAWPAPLVMCLFLDSEEEPEGANWRRLLDFGQVAIVFVLLFFYFAALSAQDSTWSTYGLSAATDGLMTAAFLARAFSMRGEPDRKLFLGIGLFRAVALLTDVYFLVGLPEYVNGAWFDLVWSGPWLIPLVTAISWTDTEQVQPGALRASRRRPRLLLAHILPLIFPVLVVVMAARVAPTQLKIAALAVLLSLGTSYARLLLTHDALRRSAEALRNQHEMLNAIVEGTTAATYVKDLQGRYLLMNSAGATLLGKSVDEIVGKNDAALFSGESAQEIIARDRETIESGVIQTYEQDISRDGVTRTLLSTKGPLRDAQGRIAGVVGSSLDITERYRAIEALAESEERFRTIFDGSPIGMAVIGTDGSIVASNSACRQMLNLNEDDLRGVAIFDELTHPDDRAADAARFQQLIRGEIEYDRREKRYILRDARRVFADLHLYLVRDKRGAARYLIGISVDITERKSLETQLRQAQRMRPAAKEQVQSLGGRFVELPIEAKDAQDARGYATAQGEEFYRKQRELLGEAVAANDVVITAAVIPGKTSPILVTKEMVARMAPGSVIVDLAAERGGNCELTRGGEMVVEHGVTIIGAFNLASAVPYHASQMYAKNVTAFLLNLVKDGKLQIDEADEIHRETLLTRGGEIVNARVREFFGLPALAAKGA